MMKSKQTKKALLSSVIALLLCFSMLLGTTFAWFTDSVTSGTNTILAGNLDVELEYYDGSSWKTVNGATNLFTGNLWEPGHTEVVYLKLSNLGSLALKYNLGIRVDSETAGINVDNEVFKLSDNIYMGVVENAQPTYTTREAAITAAKSGANGIIGKGYSKSGSMTAGQEALYLAVVVYMPESVGNKANYKTGTDVPTINLGIKLLATQLTNENDSFGPDYDKGAPWTGLVNAEWYNTTDTTFTLTTAEELAGLAQIVNAGTDTFEDKTINLGANIDLNNVLWTPIGTSESQQTKFKGTFLGNGYTISNLMAIGEKYVGLFGCTYVGAHIEGVNVVNAYVSGNDYVGTILGGGYIAKNCIKNCSVENAKVIATPYRVEGEYNYDGGAKAGVIAGVVYNGNVIGNTAKNSTVTAYRDLGGIAGMMMVDGTFEIKASENIVDNVTLIYITVDGTYDGNKTNGNMSDIVGRVGAHTSVADDNTATNVVKKGNADQWDGNVDTSWYNDTDTEFMITTAEQLAGLAELVSEDRTFAGVTIKLMNDLDLYCEDTSASADGDPVTFRPIGDIHLDGVFEGTFDGNGYVISNLYQNGWDLGYMWGAYGSYGLFGNLNDATVKNLTITGAESYIEGGDVGGITGSATGNCVFENITITDSVFATYNNGNGGIIGWSGAGNYTFKNIKLDETVTLAGLWGSFDSSIGGIVGQGEPGATYNFENVDIACRLDVYNDCTASYDYYNYRMCGMIIGRLEETTTIDGANYPDTSKYYITCKNVTVTYGEWANYHYCRANGARAQRVESGYSYGGIAENYDHTACTMHCKDLIPFDQIFGGDQYAVKGLKAYEGVKVIYNNK